MKARVTIRQRSTPLPFYERERAMRAYDDSVDDRRPRRADVDADDDRTMSYDELRADVPLPFIPEPVRYWRVRA